MEERVYRLIIGKVFGDETPVDKLVGRPTDFKHYLVYRNYLIRGQVFVSASDL